MTRRSERNTASGEPYHAATVQTSICTGNVPLKAHSLSVAIKHCPKEPSGKKPIKDSIFCCFLINGHTLITNLQKGRLNSIKIQLWGPRLDLDFAFWSLYLCVSAYLGIQFLRITAGLRMCRWLLEPSGLELLYFWKQGMLFFWPF